MAFPSKIIIPQRVPHVLLFCEFASETGHTYFPIIFRLEMYRSQPTNQLGLDKPTCALAIIDALVAAPVSLKAACKCTKAVQTDRLASTLSLSLATAVRSYCKSCWLFPKMKTLPSVSNSFLDFMLACSNEAPGDLYVAMSASLILPASLSANAFVILSWTP